MIKNSFSINTIHLLTWAAIVIIFFSKGYLSKQVNLVVEAVSSCNYLYHSNTYIDKTVKDLNSKVISPSSKNVFHLFSHGKIGQLLIEEEWRNPSQIVAWIRKKRLLIKVTHLNIYGCNFGQGEKGQAAVRYLENALNVSVAASDDVTGIDGDWDLEVGNGQSGIQLPYYKKNLQSCNCEEYVYINDPGATGPVHKFKIEPDSTFTEIFSDNTTMTPFISGGQVLLPHGVDADCFGNLYVGNIDRGASATRGIDKFNCLGVLEQANVIPNDEDAGNMNGSGGSSLPAGPVGSQTNFFIVGDKIYINSWVQDDIDGPQITVYDVCSGDRLGEYRNCDPSTGTSNITGNHWGLYINEATETAFYNTRDGIVVYDLTAPYGCQDSVIVKQGTGSTNNRGITQLPDGSLVTRDDDHIFKYAIDGTLLAGPVDMSTIVADQGLDEGGSRAYGLVSSEDGRIYVVSPGRECASLYDENLNYIKAAFVVPGGASGSAKAVAIVKECCPVNNMTTIDTSICLPRNTDSLFLKDFFLCDGSICISGDPQMAPGSTNLTFDQCVGKITIIDPEQFACGTFTLSNDGNGNANQCDAFTVTINLEIGIEPEAKVFAIQPSCVDGAPQSDGYLQISEITSGVRFNWSMGSTYTGDGNYNNAIIPTGFPYQFATGQPNPSGSQDYTIRVFSEETTCGGNHCYADYIVTMNEQDCTVGCDCEDMIYLNDVTYNEVHKFSIDSNTGAVTEIGTPWLASGIINQPHGIASDNNGNVYVNYNPDNGTLYKLNCDGEVLDNNFANISHQVFNIGSRDGVIYVHNNNGNYVEAFSTCDGSSLGRMWVDNGNNTFAWGFYMDDNNWYLPDIISGNIFSGSLDIDLYTAAPSNTGTPQFNTGYTAPDQSYSSKVAVSMTRDVNGNYYVVINQIANSAGGLSDVTILKFSPTGTLITSINDNMGTPNASNGQTGFDGGRGIVYSTMSNYIYFGNYENCITVFDTSLVEQTALNIGNPTNGLPKGLGLNTECCPTNNNINVDTALCAASIGDTLFLQDLVSCNSTICEGVWQEGMANTGLAYNSCNNSVTVTSLTGCGSFTLESDGTGNNPQCGAFKITVNIQVGTTPEASVHAIQPSCVDGVPQSDGFLQISEITSGVRFNWSMGSTYTGDPDFVNAIDTTGLTFPYQFATGQPNPSGSQDYTIRIFSASTACGDGCGFVDYTVTMNEQDCTFGCACEDYIYLNETTGGLVHKYQVQNDGSLLEILNKGSAWYPGSGTSELPSPHGLATDLNGFLYIAERYSPGQDIRKLTCDGEIFPESEFAVPSGNFATNLAGIGNTIYVNTGLSYDVCTEQSQGTVCLDGLSSTDEKWGFWYDENTGYFYSTSSDGNNGNLYRYAASDWGSGTCVAPFLTHADIFAIYQDSVAGTLTTSNSWTRGVTTDDSGNIYLTLWVGGRPSNFNAAVVKFSPDGSTVLAHTAIDDTEGNGGWYWATAPVYNSAQDILYVSTQSPSESCVYAFSASDLTPLFEAVAPSGDSGQGQSGFGVAKAMATNKECCPTNNNLSIDTTLCTASVGDSIFLQNLVNCNGTICEGIWQEGMSNTGLTYNRCNNSITVTSLTGCGSFTLESDGTGNNPQCGAFKIEVNISVNVVTASIVGADQTVCVGGDPEAFTVTTPAVGGTLSYQWQSSSKDCTTGFSNIDGAVSASYDPPSGLTDTMYYRVLVSSLNAGCSTGMCVDTSNCITVNSVPCDWGDLPDIGSGTAQGDYETSAVNNGPNHMIIDGLHLGLSVDGEIDGQSSTDALGDGVDENGIQIPNSLDVVAGGTLQIPFSALNTTGNTAYVEMWIDWNGDGDFNDPNEWVVDMDDSAGFPSQFSIPVPQGIAQDQNIGVRIRLSNTDDMTPYGAVASGEVEDYLLSINCKTDICLPTTVTIEKN